MAFAADAVLWVLNRLCSAINRIQRRCQYQAKLSQDVSMAHDLRNIAREASAAPAASFKSALSEVIRKAGFGKLEYPHADHRNQ